MPLPCPSGTISLLDIQNEFGGSNPISINEYYRNGAYVGSNNTNVPTGGQISFADFFCAVNEVIAYLGSANNVNVQTLFNSAIWQSSNITKRVIVNSGAIIGSNSASSPSLYVPNTFGGKFILQNQGTILGRGGDGGNSTSNGQQGGTAVRTDGTISIQNNGSIYGGGGGGAGGGLGGAGQYTTQTTTSGCGGAPGCPSGYYECGSGGGGCCQTYNYCCGLFNCGCTACSQNTRTRTCCATVPTVGGSGGTGGIGYGSQGNGTNGGGGAAGASGAGTGGAGGAGGGYGNPGANGSVGSNGNSAPAPTLGQSGGPGYGGPAGCYISGNSNVTWTNSGDVRGLVC